MDGRTGPWRRCGNAGIRRGRRSRARRSCTPACNARSCFAQPGKKDQDIIQAKASRRYASLLAYPSCCDSKSIGATRARMAGSRVGSSRTRRARKASRLYRIGGRQLGARVRPSLICARQIHTTLFWTENSPCPRNHKTAGRMGWGVGRYKWMRITSPAQQPLGLSTPVPPIFKSHQKENISFN
jgi:hypothetical protein